MNTWHAFHAMHAGRQTWGSHASAAGHAGRGKRGPRRHRGRAAPVGPAAAAGHLVAPLCFLCGHAALRAPLGHLLRQAGPGDGRRLEPPRLLPPSASPNPHTAASNDHPLNSHTHTPPRTHTCITHTHTHSAAQPASICASDSSSCSWRRRSSTAARPPPASLRRTIASLVSALTQVVPAGVSMGVCGSVWGVCRYWQYGQAVQAGRGAGRRDAQYGWQAGAWGVQRAPSGRPRAPAAGWLGARLARPRGAGCLPCLRTRVPALVAERAEDEEARGALGT